ncbi:AAA-domain-containing protein [Periconia macrospinosa]|uniref:AAA-domain-containing protein n=1 Tax=Periconia macrospinosa TaxID=97972 RepID=A0A2V1ECL0_9PLEO|nr:AAA-domain-containing protein [Periconia macrospinosa]
MHILRPVLRASLHRPPARLISRRRFRQSRYQTRLYSTDPNTPAGADGKPVVDDTNGSLDKKKGAEEVSEHKDAGTVTEDPELLAQSLQRSREMTRRYSSALRRTQRRNRAQDLPPVVVPKWFQEERVILYDKSSALPTSPPIPRKAEITLSLKDQDENDPAQCSVPISDPSMGVQLLNQWVSSAWHGDVSDQCEDFARTLSAELGLGDEKSILDALEFGEDSIPTVDKLRKSILRSQRERELTESIRSLESILALQDQLKNQLHVSPFTLAEIRATMAASLSSAQQSTINDTFPAARTNIILHTPLVDLDGTIHQTVKTIASELGADLVELSAQDLAELGGDYLGEGSEPSLHSIRSLGYETYRLSSEIGNEIEDLGNPEAGEYEDDTASNSVSPKGLPPPFSSQLPPLIIPLSSMLKNLTQSLRPQSTEEEQDTSASDVRGRALTQAEIQLEDLKISNLLEHIIGSIDTKRSSNPPNAKNSFDEHSTPIEAPEQPLRPKFFDFSIPPNEKEVILSSAIPRRTASTFDVTANVKIRKQIASNPRKSIVVYIQDFKELNATHYGSRIIQKLEEIVRKRRNAGERIMIVGSTCSRDLTPELSADGVQSIQTEGDAGYFRSIVVPAGNVETLRNAFYQRSTTEKRNGSETLSGFSGSTERRKFSTINMRHIQNMLRALDPEASRQISLRPNSNSITSTQIPDALFPESYCSKVMTHDEVHRVAMMTLGLHLIDPACDALKWTHVALAMSLLKASDEAKVSFFKRAVDMRVEDQSLRNSMQRVKKSFNGARSADGQARDRRNIQLQNVAATADKYEKRLMPGIVNPEQIKVGFDEVHVQPETVDAIRTLTSMSFLRPDAFNYGVLATEKISGALLYGPPGTGKTLLAKAVAKESGCTVLEVSGSQIHDKYVGEGEKNVTAIFSLARKLSPCIVFLDEADAVLSSRDGARERASARDILNQFLKEWDGLNNNSVFVMVATNRPFDLDDAVIRRLPRRLLVDLPAETDRQEILRIHLRGEQLDGSVDLAGLARQTPFYSGSDLKNVAVSAALACVKEENEQAAIAAVKSTVAGEGADSPSSQRPSLQLLQGVKYDFPEKRTLYARHFDKALQEISASVSEDMSSLNAIKKFDEKYGDKKGKKKRRVFGIGPTIETSESSARVRS